MGLMIPGARSRSKKNSGVSYQPLTLLDLELYYKATRELQKAKEIRVSSPFESIPFHPIKTSIALFLADILSKCLREEEPNPDLFEFLIRTIQYLDVMQKGIANFHLFFLIHLSRYLGFFPMNNHDISHRWFDFQTGQFITSEPLNSQFLSPETSLLLHHFLTIQLKDLGAYTMNRNQRFELLEGLISYYHLHLQGVSEIRSHLILHELFD